MKWLDDMANILGKRLKVKDMTSLFQALSDWPANVQIGTNYYSNSHYGICMIHDDISGDDIVMCSNFVKQELWQYSKNWTLQKGPEFYLHIYDDLIAKGWGQ